MNQTQTCYFITRTDRTLVVIESEPNRTPAIKVLPISKQKYTYNTYTATAESELLLCSKFYVAMKLTFADVAGVTP